MSDRGLSLSEECFLEHVAAPDFQAGVASGWWGLETDAGVEWPYVVLWVAAPQRPNRPDRYHFRFYLQDYPAKGPTSMLWDPVQKTKLEPAKRPKGTGDVAIVFRTDWNAGDMLYAPWDRLAYDAHGDWPPKYAALAWKPTRTIVHYLRLTKALFDSEEYLGA
jgi:hypothetical protein